MKTVPPETTGAGLTILLPVPNDSNVYAVEAQSGEPEWSFGTGNNIVNPAPVVSGGMVFIGSRDGTFYAVSD